MADQLTLDVIDRPARGVIPAVRRLRALRGARPLGSRAVLALGTATFVPRVLPSPTPRRVGVLTVWEDGTDVEERWLQALGPLAHGAREHWHVHGELTRAAFSVPWAGWTPDTEGAEALTDDEPALILISGQLKARWLPAFSRDAAKVIAQVETEEGYLGGLAIQTTPLNTTSCSAWRTYADARRYAFAAGSHQTAMKRDKAEEHHSTEHFMRIRPLAERGTLAGHARFGALLGERSLSTA